MDNKGFTLVELVVVISIMVILLARTMVAVKSFQDRQSVRQDANDIVEILRQVQMKASAVEVPRECTSNLNGYRVVGLESEMRVIPECDSAIEKSYLMKNARFCNPVDFTFITPAGNLPSVYTVGICQGNMQLFFDILETGSVSEVIETVL